MSQTQKIIHVAGFQNCGFFQRALNVLQSVSILFPNRLKVVEHTFSDRTGYRDWLIEGEKPFRECFASAQAKSHSSSPFVWFTKSDAETDIDCFLGGHDDSLSWCRKFVSPSQTDKDSAPLHCKIQVDDGYTKDHGYDYDLVVIGGGSGGMAAAKEAADLGARVVCLDFVKPSPMGTKWGLGGTCVNVGCIPKKLFHTSSLLRETIQADAAAFGIALGDTNEQDFLESPKTTVHWGILRENIQNYIRGLNFKYRVRLREKQVEYLNKLGRFVDKNTLEAIDKKGNKSTITSARFLIAVGGRPTPLDCEGGELAISSDDIFALENSPGKTLCVGASYISLECAGFLAGIGLDVTVAVRSILLRGFDRECSEKVGAFMEKQGIKFMYQVTPQKLAKTDNGRIEVTFSDGRRDVFDTVLSAVGRQADTAQLGLQTIGVKVNPKNLRIIGKNEQTDCPNVYAVGDVLDDTPELTPVAIQAGLLLANRLFGESNEPMDYEKVCTTVFTPLEYGCVGLSEDAAIERFSNENIEVYHREFLPLEWSLSTNRHHHNSFAKAVVDKISGSVLGLHYVGPNAGEVMQGYGTAMKKGLTYKELISTVGIHPTSSEELVTLSITKGSGEDAAAGGC